MDRMQQPSFARSVQQSRSWDIIAFWDAPFCPGWRFLKQAGRPPKLPAENRPFASPTSFGCGRSCSMASLLNSVLASNKRKRDLDLKSPADRRVSAARATLRAVFGSIMAEFLNGWILTRSENAVRESQRALKSTRVSSQSQLRTDLLSKG